MQDFKLLRKLIRENYLDRINNSKKPFVIYKKTKGFDLYTDFSKKIILNNRNIKEFLSTKFKLKKNYKNTDLLIGFFGYELLNNLIGIKLPKQKSINFPKGIFYKPESKISLKEDLVYKSNKASKIAKNFKININQSAYTKIFIFNHKSFRC